MRRALVTGWLLAGFGLASCNGSGSTVEDCVGDHCDGNLGLDPGLEGGQSACGEAKVTFTKRIPYVVLLVDQSGSMNEKFGDGTRWSVLRDALLDPAEGIVRKLENEVRFGLALYSSDNGFEGGTCPMISKVDAAFGNYQAIAKAYDAAEPFEDTPTGESLRAVAEQLQKVYVSEATPKVIVLATDGEPDTCAQPDPQNGQEESIAAAQEAFLMGVQTYVISVGDEVGEKHLQDMANAGVGLSLNGDKKAKFYQALDNGQLYEAFDTIVNGVRDCVFTLDGEIVDGFEDQGTVVLDGNALDKDDPNGYQVNNSKEIQLLGDACELIQDGDHELSIQFPCGGYEAPPVY